MGGSTAATAVARTSRSKAPFARRSGSTTQAESQPSSQPIGLQAPAEPQGSQTLSQPSSQRNGPQTRRKY